MSDLGAEVNEQPELTEPDAHFAGSAAPKGNGPSCPWCGSHEKPRTVGHRNGKFLCGCGSLHNGTDAEWRMLAEHRKHSIERRNRGAEQ